MRLGFCLPLAGFDLAGVGDLAASAEQLGYSEFWSSEVSGLDAFTPLAAVALRTSAMRVGVGIAPVFTRPPALMAMTSAAVQQLSQGRFVLGLGSSTSAIVSDWMDCKFSLPATRVRETVEALRLILGGGRVYYEGTTLHVRGFRLDLAPIDVPIMVGALGPKMVRLAGDIADGVLLTFLTPDGSATVLDDYWKGVAASGRSHEDVEVVTRYWVGLDDDPEPLRQVMRNMIGFYGHTPVYNRCLRRQGYDDEADAILQGWETGKTPGAAAAVSDALLDGLCGLRDIDSSLERIESFAAAGATSVVIAPVTATTTTAERQAAVRRVLERVAQGIRLHSRG